jgi:RNA polymerase sigma-70 factor, ECF subfamily
VRGSFGVLRFGLAAHDQNPEPVEGLSSGSIESDGSLLARVASGDLSAFEVLVDRYQAMVLSVADRMLAGASGADDVAQEALLRLWRSAGALSLGDAGAAPWLRRVVSNLCMDQLRAQGRLAVLDESVPEPVAPAMQLAGLEQLDTFDRVEKALKLLPDRQRVALFLFHYERLTIADIAARLGLSAVAVDSLLSRARRTLKKDLEAEWRELLEQTS